MIGDNGIIRQNCAKRFYVSPFIAMDVDYHFKVYPPDKRVIISICETDRNGALLTAAFSGEQTTLSDRNLARLFALHPLTVKVAGIHWQAMRLWRKKIALHKRPPPPGRHLRYRYVGECIGGKSGEPQCRLTILSRLHCRLPCA